MTKKILALILVLTLSISAFMVPASAAYAAAPNTLEVNIENVFNRVLNDLIHYILGYLNKFWPGFEEDFETTESYVAKHFYKGEDAFDTEVKAESKWSLGYSSDSLIEDFDIMNGEFFLAGSLEVFEGRVPRAVYDDQRVRVYAISDGVSGTVVHAVIDGFGFARGDVEVIRARLEEFAKANGIISLNVSVLHQHSCIDTLGMNVPLLKALVSNTGNAASSGALDDYMVTKNPEFMENLYTTTVACVEEAVANMTEGTLNYGYANIKEYIRDKRDPQSFDENIHRLRFTPNDGSAETWILQGSMHCTGYGAGPDILSADYPYYIEKNIKEREGANVVYVMGAELAITTEGELTNVEGESDVNNITYYANALADKIRGISNEITLDPVLNVTHKEVMVPVDNGILTLACREGILAAVVIKDGDNYTLASEIGYMELGNEVAVFFAPGEFEPGIFFGNVTKPEDSWDGTSWDYPALKDVTGLDNVLVFGLANDQAGYVLADNEYHSLIGENEEVNAISKKSGSTFAKGFIELVSSVK
ncbi:MAG: hypothetical protein IKC01_06680 [Clostridia bacterium]|nr:hypothetical protein [Clostridia bacterium]